MEGIILCQIGSILYDFIFMTERRYRRKPMKARKFRKLWKVREYFPGGQGMFSSCREKIALSAERSLWSAVDLFR